MHIHGLMYASVDLAYAALTMHTHATGQKTLVASFKYKIAIRASKLL